jgi:hypothetical protein
MSRALIAGVVVGVIVLLTSVVYVVTTGSIQDRVRVDVQNRVTRAQNILTQQADLEALTLLKKTQALALDSRLAKGIGGGKKPGVPALAESAITAFRADLKVTERRPDVMAVVDKSGQVIVLFAGGERQPSPVRDLYLSGGQFKYPSIKVAMDTRQSISEVWDYENAGPMKATVAPIVDMETGEVRGALIAVYAITAKEAETQKDLLGAHVAYFFGDRVAATSFGVASQQMQAALAGPLFKDGLAADAMKSATGFSDIVTFEAGSDEYVATAIKLPRRMTGELPKDHPHPLGGAVILASIGESSGILQTVRMAILVLGASAILIALLAMFATARTILGPIDEIENGLNDIINGNIDRSFQSVSPDVDGLANALNVLLARLIGRPEPGDEQYGDDSAMRPSGALTFDVESMSPKDAEAARLAQEPEEEYMQRVFKEFLEARQKAGESNAGITRESFSVKLRLSEATMKEKYQCSTVRFKVVTKDGKVTLKPVPIV